MKNNQSNASKSDTCLNYASLKRYNKFKLKALKMLSGHSDISIVNQVRRLARHVLIFKTLNEARKLEPDRKVNSASWELTSAGYGYLMVMGIRKLVDNDSRANSLHNLVKYIADNKSIITRENYICHDGKPFKLQEKVESLDRRLWELAHNNFDALCRCTEKRERNQTISDKVLAELRQSLNHPSIKKVCELGNKSIAHADRIAISEQLPGVTYSDVETAISVLIYTTNRIATLVLWDTHIGLDSEYGITQHLDQPWCSSKVLSNLHKYCTETAELLQSWTNQPVDRT